MKHVFRMLLRFYPKSFRDAFSEEMLATFERVQGEEAEHHVTRRILFLLRELWGLLAGIWVEQAPLGSLPSSPLPRLNEVAQEEERVQFHLAQTIDCIANHRFAGARFHAAEEDRARERLRALRAFSGERGGGEL